MSAEDVPTVTAEPVHLELDRPLPASWRLALRICPYCGGVGACSPCNSTGDLLGVMLLDAYERGRRHVIEGLQEVEAVRRLAVDRLSRERPTADGLKRAMGLR